MISIIDQNNRDYDFCHNRTALHIDTHIVTWTCWGVDVVFCFSTMYFGLLTSIFKFTKQGQDCHLKVESLLDYSNYTVFKTLKTCNIIYFCQDILAKQPYALRWERWFSLRGYCEKYEIKWEMKLKVIGLLMVSIAGLLNPNYYNVWT